MKFTALSYQIDFEDGHQFHIDLKKQEIKYKTLCKGPGDPECASHSEIIQTKLKGIVVGSEHHPELADFLDGINSASPSEIVCDCIKEEHTGEWSCQCQLGNSMPAAPK